MSGRAPRLSVIVCGYTTERLDDLCCAINSVRAQTPPPDELIVVVDNNRVLADLLGRRVGADVRMVENEGSPGLSAARNVGALASSGDVLAFMDDDAVAEPDWLSRLVDPFGDPRVVAVGGCILPDWPTGARPDWLPHELDWVVACTYKGMPMQSDHETRNVIGCNMAFRRSALETVGWFNTELGRVGKATGQAEDTEVCLRLRRQLPAGRILFAPDAVVHHKVPLGRLTVPFLLKRAYNEGFYKVRMQKLVPLGDRHALSSERIYLGHLLFRFLPSQLKQIYRPNVLARMGVTAAALAGVGAGAVAAWTVSGSAQAH